MTEKMRKILGIGGAIAVAIGAGAIALSGGDVGNTSGIVGLSFATIAAIVALINGVKK